MGNRGEGKSRTHLPTLRRWRHQLAVRLVVVGLGGVGLGGAGLGCPPPAPPPPLVCGGEAERCVVAGQTSAAVCGAGGRCLGSDVPCQNDRDCFFAIDEGDTIPAWSRPQGGLGTRLNLRLEGYSDEERFTGLQTLLLGDIPLAQPPDAGAPIPCDALACAAADSCPCDAELGFSCVALPDGTSICAELICDQVNRRFPMASDGMGALVVPELPVRFRNEFGLDDLDGREVTLFMGVIVGEDDVEFTTRPIRLEVGDFVLPSWWEE